MRTQACPNCHAVHDIGVYVTGQRMLCPSCGIRFEVKRKDVTEVRARGQTQLPPRATGPGAGPGSDAPDRALATPAPVNAPATAPVVLEVHSAPTDADARTVVRPREHDPQEARTVSGEMPQTFISAPAPAPALRLPGYELLDVLGRGGMGEVWRARQTSLGRMVAVKVLPAKLARDPEFVARFEKESTALAALSHPNVIQIFDRGVAGESAYFTMELVQGRSLRDLINAGRVPPADALRIAIQISRAIDYAHEQHIVHRDLKPENILLDGRGHVKVADFGLAGFRGSEDKGSITGTRVAMGTLNYMAPEQRRDARSVDGRADIYSLGVILYELLTGELPIGRFKLPSERDPSLDRRLDEVVSRALEPEPDARFARASEIAAILEVLAPSSSAGVTSTGGGSGWSAPRPESGIGASSPKAAASLVRSGVSGLKVGLMVVGTLSLLGVLVKAPWAPAGGAVLPGAGRVPTVAWPPNTNGDLFTDMTEEVKPNGQMALTASFSPGAQELNAHAGDWRLENGKLVAIQAGNDTAEKRLVPRLYLAGRYFSSDDLSLETEMAYQQLDYEPVLEEGHQHFSELALRLKGLQVSVFAIPDVGMRLLWRYTDASGKEIVGNSARDPDSLAYDERPVPPPGEPFKVRLTLRKQKGGGTLAEAFINGSRFARKVLPGFSGQVGKVAVGCRNLRCEFSELGVVGNLAQKPPPAVSASEAQ